MAKEIPEYLLKVIVRVYLRADNSYVTSFYLGEFTTVRAAEKLRNMLSRYNPDKLFLVKYEQIPNPIYQIIK